MPRVPLSWSLSKASHMTTWNSLPWQEMNCWAPLKKSQIICSTLPNGIQSLVISNMPGSRPPSSSLRPFASNYGTKLTKSTKKFQTARLLCILPKLMLMMLKISKILLKIQSIKCLSKMMMVTLFKMMMPMIQTMIKLRNKHHRKTPLKLLLIKVPNEFSRQKFCRILTYLPQIKKVLGSNQKLSWLKLTWKDKKSDSLSTSFKWEESNMLMKMTITHLQQSKWTNKTEIIDF